MVETSVAVATPSVTAPRTRKGRTSAGAAIISALPIIASGARRTPSSASPRAFQRAAMARISSRKKATTKPLAKSAAIEIPATEPMTMSTIEGGTVSAMIAPVPSRATISSGLLPRRFISGKSAGATVAISETLEPDMPETR